MNSIYTYLLISAIAFSLSAKPLKEAKVSDDLEENKYFKEKVEDIKGSIAKARNLREEQLAALRKRLSRAETEKDRLLADQIEKEISATQKEIDSLQSRARTELDELKEKERELGNVTKDIQQITNQALKEYDYGIEENLEDCIRQDIATKSLLRAKKLGLSQRSELNNLLTKLSSQLAKLLIYEHTKFKDTEIPPLTTWQLRRSKALEVVPSAKEYDQKYQELLNSISYIQSEIAKLLNIKKEIFEKEFDVYSTGELCAIELFSKFTGPVDIAKD